MTDIIEKYYKKYNYPASAKLFNLIKRHETDSEITRNDVQDFISHRLETELLKRKLKSKKFGHITSPSFQYNSQLDIFDLSKYSRSNRGYKYLLVIIDVFSRKVWIIPMKTKNEIDVNDSLKEIFKHYKPTIITSDTDPSFSAKKTQKLFEDNNIIHDVVIARDDHRALGIIDRFALTIKSILSKLFIIIDKTNWIDTIDEIIDNYNNTPHSSIENLTPNQATNEINRETISLLNQIKSGNTSFLKKSIFKPGDLVRMRITKTFRKGTEPRYTDDLFVVDNVIGRRVTLSNGRRVLDTELLKTNFKEGPIKYNPIDIESKRNTRDKLHKQLDIDETNIRTSKRNKKVKKHDDYIY